MFSWWIIILLSLDAQAQFAAGARKGQAGEPSYFYMPYSTYRYVDPYKDETKEQRTMRLFKEHLEYKGRICKAPVADYFKRLADVKKKIKEATPDYTYSATSAIDEFEEYCRLCEIDLRKFGLSDAWFENQRYEVYEKSLEPLVKKIQAKVNFASVLYEIGQYSNLAKNAGVSKETIDSNIKKWTKKSHQIIFEELVKRFDLKSQYVNIEPELKDYFYYAEKLGIDHHEIKTQVNHWLVESQKALKKEKASCTGKIDLRNDKLGPPREQGPGWCFATAIADTLSYKLGVKVSSADIAIQFYNQPLHNTIKKFGAGEQDMFFGVDAWAFSKLKAAGGACLESKFKSEDFDYAGGSIKTTLQDIDTIKKFKLFENNPTCENLNHYSPPIKALFPGLGNIDQYLINSSREDLIRDMANASCGKRISLDKIESHFYPGVTEDLNKRGIAVIDEQLGKKNIVSISYNCDIHDGEGMDQIKPHAGTIVGRRYNESKQRCEYLVRGTWGKSGSYGSWESEGGNFWLPRWALMMSLYGVNYLD